MADTTIVAAVITAVVAFVTALVAGIFALWTEGRRRRQEREDARLTDVRLSAAEVFKEMFVLQHEIEWVTWHARFRPEAVNAEMLAAYDAAVHASIPRLLGSLAVLTSRDRTFYDRVFPLADELFTLDGQVARLAADVRRAEYTRETIDALAAEFGQAEKLWLELPMKMAAALEP